VWLFVVFCFVVCNVSFLRRHDQKIDMGGEQRKKNRKNSQKILQKIGYEVDSTNGAS
jgi:hypothetical protein